MSSVRGEERCAHSDLVSDFVAGALDVTEASAVALHFPTCTDCQRELEALGLVVDAFVNAATDLVCPPADLGARLAQQIAAETGMPAVAPQPEPWTEPEWEQVGGGISCKVLATDSDTQVVSMLVRLAPGAEYPPHRHARVEELFLLCGELWIDNRLLHPGDYNRGEPGATDTRVYSETGCICVLITSLEDELLR